MQAPTPPRVAHAYPPAKPVSCDPLGRPVRPTCSPGSGGLPDRLPGRLHAAWIARKRRPCVDRQAFARTRWGTCRAYVLRPANQLRRLVRFTDQMAATGMRNGRSHSRSQMRIDTSCDVAKLAVTFAQGRVLSRRGDSIPSPAPVSPDRDQRNIHPEERHAGTAETARRHPHQAFTYSVIPFRFPKRTQCG